MCAAVGCQNDSYILPKAGLLTAAQSFALALEDSFWFNDPNLAALPLHLIHAGADPSDDSLNLLAVCCAPKTIQKRRLSNPYYSGGILQGLQS